MSSVPLEEESQTLNIQWFKNLNEKEKREIVSYISKDFWTIYDCGVSFLVYEKTQKDIVNYMVNSSLRGDTAFFDNFIENGKVETWYADFCVCCKNKPQNGHCKHTAKDMTKKDWYRLLKFFWVTEPDEDRYIEKIDYVS